MMRKKGFSLVELMIVVAIIAILAAVAIPLYANYVIRANIGKEIAKVGGLKAEIGEALNNTSTIVNPNYSKDTNVVYDENGNIGIAINNNGTAADTYDTSAPGFIRLSPTINSGSISWSCAVSGNAFSQSKIPSNCTYYTSIVYVNQLTSNSSSEGSSGGGSKDGDPFGGGFGP